MNISLDHFYQAVNHIESLRSTLYSLATSHPEYWRARVYKCCDLYTLDQNLKSLKENLEEMLTEHNEINDVDEKIEILNRLLKS